MRLLISTGEVSGDLQGSFLVKALKEEASKRSMPLQIFALGGSRMKNAGADMIANTALEREIDIARSFLDQKKYQDAIDTCNTILTTNANSIEAIKLIGLLH